MVIIAAPEIFDSEEKAKLFCEEQNKKISTTVYHKLEYEVYNVH